MRAFRFSYQRMNTVFQLIILLEAAFAIWQQQWHTAVIAVGILVITFIPLLLEKRFRVFIPPPFQLLAIAFIFASLFLGEIHDYYNRYWWWDIALHTSSGLLLGVIGFLLVYVLNETENTGVHIKPGFIALFAFMFAVAIGALWEIFEFLMDTFLGTQMQKPMLGDSSGLTDTMIDLIVDALGALIISVYGYIHLKMRDRQSFIDRWIKRFISDNPQFFRDGD